MCGFGGGLNAATSLVNTGMSVFQGFQGGFGGGGSGGGAAHDQWMMQQERQNLLTQQRIAAANAEEARRLAEAEASRIRRDGQEAVARQRSLQASAGGVVGSGANLLLNDDMAERFELDALGALQRAPAAPGGGAGDESGAAGGGLANDPLYQFFGG